MTESASERRTQAGAIDDLMAKMANGPEEVDAEGSDWGRRLRRPLRT